jgi:hypothetical protein
MPNGICSWEWIKMQHLMFLCWWKSIVEYLTARLPKPPN